MNNEEKILELLEKHTEMLSQMQGEQMQMHAEQKQLQAEQKQMRDDITSIKLRLELDIEKRFDVVNEGIDSILEKLTPKSRVDEMEADIIVLKTAVKAMAQRIAELEKAQ